MSTFPSERTVVVCNLAIGRVRERVDRELGLGVRYSVVDGG